MPEAVRGEVSSILPGGRKWRTGVSKSSPAPSCWLLSPERGKGRWGCHSQEGVQVLRGHPRAVPRLRESPPGLHRAPPSWARRERPPAWPMGVRSGRITSPGSAAIGCRLPRGGARGAGWELLGQVGRVLAEQEKAGERGGALRGEEGAHAGGICRISRAVRESLQRAPPSTLGRPPRGSPRPPIPRLIFAGKQKRNEWSHSCKMRSPFPHTHKVPPRQHGQTPSPLEFRGTPSRHRQPWGTCR